MFLRRVTSQMEYPASTNGSNHLRDIRAINPWGRELPGPPGRKRSVFGPRPQVKNSIPFAKLPLWRLRGLAMRRTALSAPLRAHGLASRTR